MPDINSVTGKLQEAGAVVPGKRLRLDFGDEGSILLDGIDNAVSNDADAAADTTIKVSLDNFVALANGKLNPTMAFMSGKLQISGDLGVAMQLQSVTSKMAR
ncbi:MAG: SCP2 sterol-binding domain-containing protein [Sphingomonas sp.]